MKRHRLNGLLSLLHVRELPVVVLFVGALLFFNYKVPGFIEWQGLPDSFRAYTPHLIIAVGLTLIIGTAGIDISVGSVVGFSAVLLGVLLSRTEISLGLACAAAVGSGAVVGAFNGWAVSRMRLQPVVVTLSTMAAVRGLAYIVAGTGVSSIDLPERADWLGWVNYESPAPLVLAAVVAAAGYLALARTTFGRSVLAIGSNEEAARLSGIGVERVKFTVYAVTGALAGIAGVMTTGMMYTSTTEAGMGYEFEAITAVLMGGTSIMGGEATVIGSVFGILAVAVINRGFGMMAIENQDQWRMMCLGLILISSVLLDGLRKYIARRSAQAR